MLIQSHREFKITSAFRKLPQKSFFRLLHSTVTSTFKHEINHECIAALTRTDYSMMVLCIWNLVIVFVTLLSYHEFLQR